MPSSDASASSRCFFNSNNPAIVILRFEIPDVYPAHSKSITPNVPVVEAAIATGPALFDWTALNCAGYPRGSGNAYKRLSQSIDSSGCSGFVGVGTSPASQDSPSAAKTKDEIASSSGHSSSVNTEQRTPSTIAATPKKRRPRRAT